MVGRTICPLLRASFAATIVLHMMPTDRATCRRYISILEAMTADALKSHPGAMAHRREIDLALEAACARTLNLAGPAEPTDGSLGGLQPPFTAARGEAIAVGMLNALAAVRFARPAGANNPAAERAVMDLLAAQLPSGEFLLATRSDNPEPHWYHELVILHAVASFALHSGRAEAWAAVERAAEFHLSETQPDHATTEPWGLFAFVRCVDTLPLADQLLHAVQTQHPHGLDRVSWMLLRDALYCLRRSIEAEGEAR